MPTSSISVVVLTFNRRAELLVNLERLICNCPGVPILVVDNGSQDGTAAAVRSRFPEIEVLEAGANHGAAGRNLGVLACKTAYVAFSDDDTCWEPGALATAVRLLDAATAIAVLSARVLVGENGDLDPTCEQMANSPLGRADSGEPLLLGYMAGACVMRRAIFLDAGGYDPRLFLGAEEALLTLDIASAGGLIVYADAVATRHYPSPLRDASQRRWLLARNAIWIAWLRLPWRLAWRESREQWRIARRSGQGAQVVLASLRGLHWVLAERRVVPPRVVRMRERLLTATG
jgi:GT2 family glycosyltransferase